MDNLENLFILNFNWVISILGLIGLILYLSELYRKRIKLDKTLLFLFLFSITYMILVFSFPTWTITRYVIPCMLLIAIFAGYALSDIKMISRNYKFSILIIIFFLLVPNFFSVDPITISRFAKYHTYDVQLYNTYTNSKGFDGLVYNLNFAQATKNQNALIESIANSNANYVVGDCMSLKLEEKLSSINIHTYAYNFESYGNITCITSRQIPGMAPLMANKRIYVQNKEQWYIVPILTANGINPQNIIIGR